LAGLPLLSVRRTPEIVDPESPFFFTLNSFDVGNQELTLDIEVARILGQEPGTIRDRVDESRHFVKNHYLTTIRNIPEPKMR